MFSGIGGLDLALEALGFTVAWQSEYDPHCSKVLARHWPDVPNLGDVTTIDWTKVPHVDCIAGGYPCQPFSHAGRRAGEDDERHLWPYVAAAVRCLRPRLVVLENVAGHLSLGFGSVLGDLATMGYDARWGCVRASDAGAPHQRRRVFIVADAHDQRSQGRHVGRDSTGQRASGSASVGVDWREYEPAIRRWERIVGEPAPEPLVGRRLNPELPRWMMGLPPGWLDGMTTTQALKAAGNAVCPQQAVLALDLLGISGNLT